MTKLFVSNSTFLSMLFGKEAARVHVTDFPYDPNNIPENQRLIAWKGDYFSQYRMGVSTNQYFAISLFHSDDQQQARRRKALYKCTPVIVLDDVREKLLIDEVLKLPSPTWILETSAGSEQWGYLLDTPCTNRERIENLLDGLVQSGLAPGGRDPGMRGVTRYVRLPEGCNTKLSKRVAGRPWRCQMRKWAPFNRVTLEALAAPFGVDLDRSRTDVTHATGATIFDHPVLELLHIKQIHGAGRYDVTCPWVTEHTNAVDNGSGLFTNQDGTLGYKCHHGACQNRTGADLLRLIEQQQPGFNEKLKTWQISRQFAQIPPSVSFLTPLAEAPHFTPPKTVETISAPIAPGVNDIIQPLCNALEKERPSSLEARELSSKILRYIDTRSKIDQKHWHRIVRNLMHWTKTDLDEILKDLRKKWYSQQSPELDIYKDVVFIEELNKLYHFKSRIFFTPEAFHNSFAHVDSDAKNVALQSGKVEKVNRLDFAPGQSRIFTEKNIRYANTWDDSVQSDGSPGDCTPWLQHFTQMGWESHRGHIEKWMAYTLRYPQIKINHMLLLGSAEGCGKDFLLYPLVKAMGVNQNVISGEEFIDDYSEYLLSAKYLHINETELGDRREALKVSNKLKPLAAAPPDTLNVNQKHIGRIKIRNVVNVTMTTNSLMPLRLTQTSRRFYAIWSDLNVRDSNANVTPAWEKYWTEKWEWMKTGWQYVVYYLINQVSLDTFNPRSAPPMTEFLRDIQDSSKSPMQQTIELFIQKKHGAFRSDILTAADISEMLRAGVLFHADILCDSKLFTPKRVSMILRELGYPQMRDGYAKLWLIRNADRYAHMGCRQVFVEYEKQLLDARKALGLCSS